MSSLDLSPDVPRSFWRSLDERAGTPEFRAFVEREFPAWADEMLEPASRRRFLKLMGASMAFAGMTACRWPVEPIVPFAHRPEGYVPGEPLHYATAIELFGAAVGLVVTSYDGRPIKIEGNPDHAYSLGGTLAWHQAALLELYDPDRSQHVVARDGAPASWDAFAAFARLHFDALRTTAGRGLAVLAEPSSSPSRRIQHERFQAAFPHARWHEYEPLSRDNAREGARLAFGAPHRTHLALDRAETIVALDEDFLLHHPAAVRYARDFVAGRDPSGSFSRLWVVETNLSLTGSVADRRITLANRALPAFATCLLAKLVGEAGVALPAALAPLAPALEAARSHPVYARVDSDLVLDLASKHGRTAVLAGPGLTPEAHAVVHALNAALGNVGRTVSYTVEADPDRPHHSPAIRELARDMGRNLVETLVILGGNPAYDAPADLGFADLLPRVQNSIRLAAYADETSRVSSWHVPRAHALESWGDARDFGGTLCLVQPLIEPLHGGRSDLELLEMLLGADSANGHDIVRRTFDGDDRAWHAALRAGVVEGSARPIAQPVLGAAAWAERVRAALGPPSAPPAGAYEVVFAPDASLLDGRFANNGWLQELADPLTKLTWDNAATVAPETAAELRVEQGDVVRLVRGGASVELPVFLLPGQAPRTIGAALGYGRTRAGHVGTGAGVDVYALRVGEQSACGRRAGRAHRPDVPPGDDAGPLRDRPARRARAGRARGRARPRGRRRRAASPRRRARGERGARGRRGRGRRAAARAVDATSGVRRRALGHGDRPQRLHRLQRVRRRLPGREQHPGRRQGRGRARPRDALDPHRPLLRRRARRARGRAPAGDLPPLRERAVRAGLPGRRDRARRRRPQRHGLQPLHRHAVLREQLPVQGPPVQLLQQPQVRERASR